MQRASFTGSVRSWCRLAIAFAFAVLGAGEAATAGDEPYRLGVGDKLRIAVYERADLSGEFAIGPSASLSLPLLGRVPAEGLSLAELEAALAERLAAAAGLKEPRLSVEIVQYRPFFILGAVENSGQYPYVNGMTVLHAISIAGGYRKADAQDALLRLEAERARERYHLVVETQAIAIARRSRLLAERDELGEIVFPPALADTVGETKAAALAAHERVIMEQRTLSFQNELAVMESQKSILGDEIRALEGQLTAKGRVSELNQQEIAEIEKLRQRDLVPITRLLGLRRLAAELEGDRRQLSAFIARAKQEIIKVDLSLLNLRKARTIQVLENIKQVDDELVQLAISRRAATEQIARAETAVSRLVARAPLDDAKGEVVIVRRGPDGQRELVAHDLTPVLPGDVVKVPARLSPAAGSAPANGAARAP